jgi:hypothetical protein
MEGVFMNRPVCMSSLLVLFSFLFVGAQIGAGQEAKKDQDQLYSEFLNPPKDYSLMPFWFWNGKMEGTKVQEEVRRMVDQHVYGAFLHARDGLETPYLSEEWWKAIGAGLEESKRSGFEFNFVDEYDWPSGEVRNIWMAGNHQSEVLARNPNFRMKSIAYKDLIVHGPKSVDLPAVQDLQSVVVARWLGAGRIESQSLQSIELPKNSSQVQWNAPDGDWIVSEFYLEPSMGFDGGVVDLMSPDAMKLYFDLSYGEFYRRFGSYFGSTIRYSFSDHEGDFGYRIGWTPALFDTFTHRTGYDLRKVLPLLIYDGGAQSRKVRQDYLATVTQLYQDSYWNGITDKARQLGIGRSGHAWEETLQSGAAFEGSLFALERGLNPVGVDSLGDFGRQPLNFKVAQSVADFEGRRFACENQGVQGNDSYLDMQGLRKGTNPIGAWGVNLYIPHAFDYDVSRANYAPDWLHQPYWPYFHYYADYTRRISYMNSEDSRHVTNVLLYYPMLSVWAETDPVFSNQTDFQRLSDPATWKNRTVLVNDYYVRMMLRLAERQWDYNIADDYYFERARVEGKELVIGPQRFRAIILPPITTISPATLKKLQEFYQAGGTILGIRMLPSSADEAGEQGKITQTGIDEIFGDGASKTPNSFTENHNGSNGQSFYVSESVETLIDLLDAHLPKDTQVVSGPSDHLYVQHREKTGRSYYWLVNDTAGPRSTHVLFSTSGIPEKWDALTGKRSPLFYVNRPEGTEVWLDFGPWDAYFVLFGSLNGTPQRAELLSTNAENLQVVTHDSNSIVVRASAPADQKNVEVVMKADRRTYRAQSPAVPANPISLSGDWNFRPEPDRVSTPYAKVKDVPANEGEKFGFAQPDFDDTSWAPLWLSEAQNTIRTWNLIGPFSNREDEGFSTVYPPEKEFNLEARYTGLDGQPVAWENYYGDEPYLSKSVIWMETSGGHFDDDSPVVDISRALHASDKPWIAAYAHTHLYSPSDQAATLVVASDNWAKIWLNHREVFGQLRHPFWYETNDNWADRIPVELHKGWNEVLVKVGVGRGSPTGVLGFTFRVADAQGKTLSTIVSSLSSEGQQGTSPSNEKKRWYRLEIPPGTIAVVPPSFEHPYRLIVNGQELKTNGEAAIDFQKLLRPKKNTLVIESESADHLSSPLLFVSGTTSFALQPWTKTGLAQFSGTGIYEKSFSLPAPYVGKRILLDLGRVSSVAEVQINGHDAGTLIWSPYRLDITKFVKPGENRLKIRVTNTEANARAVGSTHNILANIDMSGLEGPVAILPYVEQTLTLKPE